MRFLTQDEKTVDAVQRGLARIGEAAVKLSETAEDVWPGVAWRDIRGLGNHLRDGYRRVDLSRIWAMVEEHLPALKSACADAFDLVIHSQTWILERFGHTTTAAVRVTRLAPCGAACNAWP